MLCLGSVGFKMFSSVLWWVPLIGAFFKYLCFSAYYVILCICRSCFNVFLNVAHPCSYVYSCSFLLSLSACACVGLLVVLVFVYVFKLCLNEHLIGCG